MRISSGNSCVYEQIRYHVGESSALIADGSLVHNTVFDVNALQDIFRLGATSGEIGDGIKPVRAEQNETHYCADFFRVDKALVEQVCGQADDEKLLAAYYAFVRTKIEIRRTDGAVHIRKGRQEEYCSPAQRNDYVSFVFDVSDSRLTELMRYAVDGKSFSIQPDNPLSPFIQRFPRENEPEVVKNHVAVLVGLPANFMTAIVVGGRVADSPEKIRTLYKLLNENNLHIPVVSTDGKKIEAVSEEDEIARLEGVIDMMN